MNDLIADIKKKKELTSISDSFVKDQIKKYLQKNPKAVAFLKSEYSTRSSKYKAIIKEIRSPLRRSYGLFRNKIDFAELQQFVANNKIQKILQKHASTKERILFYKQLYKEVFNITGKPQSIIDLGCGLNYFSLTIYDLTYYGYDISKDEIQLINSYLHKRQKNGEAKVLDILTTKKIEKLPPSDVAFLFKMTDVLDRGKGHKKTEAVVTAVPSSYVVVSFPTITMSNKTMRFLRRKWFELMCDRLGYSFHILEFTNELFYVVKKIGIKK